MFSLVISEDDLPVIYKDDMPFARALTERDGKKIVDELNIGSAGMRDRLIDAMTDVIEQAFEERK